MFMAKPTKRWLRLTPVTRTMKLVEGQRQEKEGHERKGRLISDQIPM